MIRDVNFTFLWLILLLIASVAGMSLRYQEKYGDVLGKYTATAGELDRAIGEAKTKESTLNETLVGLNIAKERETVLSEKYNTLRGEKEILEKEKKNVETQLKDTQSELASLKLEHNKLQEDFKILKSAWVNATIKITWLQEKVSDLYAINQGLASQLSECQSKQG